MKIPAKGCYQRYDDIEIDGEELDTFQLEWIVETARKKKLIPEPRTQEIAFIEEALSLLWRKDLIGLEKLITRQLLSETRTVEDIRDEYMLLMARKHHLSKGKR